MPGSSILSCNVRHSTATASRRSASARAKPDCPLCGGKGWTMRRIEIPFIGGVEAVPCKCTEGARDG